jgi:hypothetical protein
VDKPSERYVIGPFCLYGSEANLVYSGIFSYNFGLDLGRGDFVISILECVGEVNVY